MATKRVMADFVQDDTKLVRIEHSPAVDVTGSVFDLTLKADLDPQTVAVLAVSSTAGDHPDDAPALGLVHLLVPGSATSAVPAGSYYGSIKRTDALGQTTTLVQSGVDGVARVVCYPTLLEKVV